jgi:hypothetical protein
VLTASRSGGVPLTRSHGHRTARPYRTRCRGRRIMFRHSLARAREDARYQRETIREYAATRRFSNRLRCGLIATPSGDRGVTAGE